MSILIADSGASHTRWIISEGGRRLAAYETIGLNPNAVAADIRFQELNILSTRIHLNYRPTALFFYGSGLSDKGKKEKITEDFVTLFPETAIYIENDLVAAARSTGREKGIVAILGTGSIACSYLNGQVIERQGGHGYLVGDEGSGQDLGKALLQSLLYDKLPQYVHEYVLEQEGKTLHELKMGTYASMRPSAYLSALARHLSPFLSEPSVEQLIRSRFDLFFQTSILSLPVAQQQIVDFVGSVAFFFKDLLKESCHDAGLVCGQINRSPIEGLIQFHSKDEV